MGRRNRNRKLHSIAKLAAESAKGGTPSQGENCRANRRGSTIGGRPPKRRPQPQASAERDGERKANVAGRAPGMGRPEGSAARNGEKAKTSCEREVCYRIHSTIETTKT